MLSELPAPILATSMLFGCYLWASFSWAWLVARCHNIDLRQHGSGNLGATNVGRVLGGRYFILVFLADMAKGLLPLLGMMYWLTQTAQIDPERQAWWLVGCGLAAVLGHIFPCWHGFRGGKAVATSLGVLIALTPIVAGAAFILWLICWSIGRLTALSASNAVGPASVIAALASALIQTFWHGFSPESLPISCLVLFASLLIIVRHHRNITELFRKKPLTTQAHRE